MADPVEVRINGVLYVPVSEASIDAKKIRNAIGNLWWGPTWRHNTDLSDVFVVVTDDEDDEGTTVDEFIARVIADG